MISQNNEHQIQDKNQGIDESRSLSHTDQSTSVTAGKLVKPCKKAQDIILLAAMLLLCSYIIGSLYYCVDQIGGLEATTIKVIGIDVTQYNILFSCFVWGDVVMAIAGGIIIDMFLGIRLGLIVFMAIAVLTQCIVSLGAYLGAFWIMFIGRSMFGCAVGTLTSAVTNALVTVFESKAVFATSFRGSIFRLCAVIALFSTQRLYDSLNFLPNSVIKLGTTISTGVVATSMALIFAIIVFFIDKKKFKKLGRTERKPFSISQLVRAIRSFSLTFWLLCLIVGLYYSVLFSLVSNAQLFFISKYGLSTNEASLVNSLTYATTILLTPFIGLLINITGYRSVWMMIGAVIGLMGHVILLAGSNSVPLVYIAAILVSLSYGVMVGLLGASIALAVDPANRTIALGIATSIYSLGYCILSVAEGVVIDYKGFALYEIISVEILFVTMLLVILLWVEEFITFKKKQISRKIKQGKKSIVHLSNEDTLSTAL